MIAQDYRRGQRMLTDRNFKDNAQFFQVRPPLEPPHAAAAQAASACRTLDVLHSGGVCGAASMGTQAVPCVPCRMPLKWGAASAS